MKKENTNIKEKETAEILELWEELKESIPEENEEDSMDGIFKEIKKKMPSEDYGG